MRTRSAISLLTLIAFLPLAAGCSTSRTSYVQDDVVTDETTAKLASGERVWITGYTTRIDGHHRWKGHVATAGSDSLEFEPRSRESDSWRSPEAPAFRIARTDVVSLEVETADGPRTAGVVALAVAIGAIALTIMLASAVSDAFEQDTWSQGTR